MQRLSKVSDFRENVRALGDPDPRLRTASEKGERLEASNRLLFILPALFIPIYVAAIGQGQFWSQMAGIPLPALLVATASLWIFVGHLSQRFLSGSDE